MLLYTVSALRYFQSSGSTLHRIMGAATALLTAPPVAPPGVRTMSVYEPPMRSNSRLSTRLTSLEIVDAP